jgi:glycine cleavage system H lipoate-binding protein
VEAFTVAVDVPTSTITVSLTDVETEQLGTVYAVSSPLVWSWAVWLASATERPP